MKNSKRKTRSLIRLISVLCFLVAMSACVIGVMTYRNMTRRIFQNLVHVELTDFIENTRYSLHFGKDIETFFRMNEILTEQTEDIGDVEGLYVVKEDGQVLYATDGRELSGRVRKLLDSNFVEGNQFYVGMRLSEDGSTRLIARCSSKDIRLRQSTYLFRFLLECLVGFILLEILIILLARIFAGHRHLVRIMLGILALWIVTISTVVGIRVGRNYQTSLEEMGSLIQSSITEDINRVKALGIKEESVLPYDTYYRKDFDIYASMTPAKEVGGDFYDFFLIDSDHLALVMADVSGKGVPAALFMVNTRTLIKNCALAVASPDEILASVNNQLCENNDAMLFVTAWVGILTLSTGVLATADAGHEYPAIWRNGSEGFELVKAKHYAPLATMEGNEYEEFPLTLEKGDVLFLYTDGVTDARNDTKEKYGTDRMIAAISAHASGSPQDTIRGAREDIASFIGENEQFDDITMMCVKYYG